MGNLYLPSPRNQGWENGVLWLLCGFILDLGKVGGGGGSGLRLLFHVILSKTVVSKKIASIMYVQAPYTDTVSHFMILNITAF